jgi:hypothetical protein
MKVKKLKNMLDRASMNHLEKFYDILTKYETKIPKTNPNYGIISELKMYIEELMKSEKNEMMTITDIVV